MLGNYFYAAWFAAGRMFQSKWMVQTSKVVKVNKNSVIKKKKKTHRNSNGPGNHIGCRTPHLPEKTTDVEILKML